MADRLTQLQDCLDDMLTQMYATLNYIQTKHPYGEIPGQPNQGPDPAPVISQSANDAQANGHASPVEAANTTRLGERTNTPPPEQPVVFQEALRELAQGLVLKEQQMEILINSLPGLGNNERDQERRMRELQVELAKVEKERERAEQERDTMIDGLGDLVGSVGRIP